MTAQELYDRLVGQVGAGWALDVVRTKFPDFRPARLCAEIRPRAVPSEAPAEPAVLASDMAATKASQHSADALLAALVREHPGIVAYHRLRAQSRRASA